MLFQEGESLTVTVLLLGSGSGVDILGKHSSAFGKTLRITVVGRLVEDKVKQRPLGLFIYLVDCFWI